MKIQMRAAAGAFEAWVAMVEERKWNRLAVRRCLAKMRMRAAAAALERWGAFAADRAAARRFLSKMYGRWMNKEVSKGWAQWYLVHSIQKSRPSGAADHEELHRLRSMTEMLEEDRRNAQVQRVMKRRTAASTQHVALWTAEPLRNQERSAQERRCFPLAMPGEAFAMETAGKTEIRFRHCMGRVRSWHAGAPM